MSHTTTISTVLLLAALAWPSFASASSLESEIASANRINAANAMLREGKIAEAIDGYQQVRPADAHRDALDYNLGVAHFRSGDLAAAKEAFTGAAASGDAQLASSSRYNLGNCFYSEGLQQAEKDKAAAIESLQQAISQYRGSLRGNSDNPDARANIELASQLIHKLEEEQKQQQQQQDQQNQDQQKQEQQNQDQQNQDQQQQGSGDDQQEDQQNSQSQSSEDQQSNDQKNQSESSQDSQSDDSANQDQQQKQDLSQPADQQDQQQQPGQESQDQDQSQDHQSNQRAADGSQASSTGEPSAEEENAELQEIPQGKLSTANEQDQDHQPARAAMADPNAKDGLMSKEEALKMLQAVRDRDMLRRLRQEQAERSRHVPVDRDW